MVILTSLSQSFTLSLNTTLTPDFRDDFWETGFLRQKYKYETFLKFLIIFLIFVLFQNIFVFKNFDKTRN